ncbi:MAG: DUF4139 domain-containing protein [Chloroflexota bacterium]|nr:DUF4139 domain-containing protein [Chloroflexota bacterium]
MQRCKTALCAVVFLLGGLYSSLAQEPSQSIAVTVYNQGTALIREQRRLMLDEGVNRIDLRDVAASIDPTSVSLRSLSNPEGTVVLEQNYSYDLVNSSALLSRYLDETIKITAADGTLYSGELLSGRSSEAILRADSGEIVVVRLQDARDIRFPALPEALITRPTLQWLLSSASAGEQDIELTYLAGGVNWSADYNLLLTSEQNSFDLKGWVTLNNHSGRAFTDVRLRLVAGDLSRIQPPEVEESRMMAMDMDLAGRGGGGIAQRELFEYQLYEIERLVTIGNNETKQIEFVSGAKITANTFFVFDKSPQFGAYYSPVDYPEGYGVDDSDDVFAYLEFNTGEDSGLGADLPAGRVRVYQQDGDGAGLLIGENLIDHSPEGEDVQILLGKSFDLVGERAQSSYETVSRDVARESFAIRLRNRKEDETVEIRVPERLYRWSDWQIVESSMPYKKLDSSTIEFRVEVAPGAEAAISYTVQYVFPSNR